MPAPSREPALFADYTGHTRWDEYLKEFEGAGACRLVGEKSGAHLYDPRAAKRIHSYDPRAKIIIALRSPLDMAYSLYLHNRREGYETLATFGAALAAEDERATRLEFRQKSRGYYANYLYRRRATYFPQVKRYVDAFGRDQVLLVRFADLRQDAQSVCHAIFRFLDVDERTVPDLTPENEGGTMRLQLLQNWYMRNVAFRKLVMRMTPQSLRKRVYRLNRRRSVNRRLSPSERRSYSMLFADDIRRMEQEYAIKVA